MASPEDYTVGVVCADSDQLLAVVDMFDEKYLPSSRLYDNNRYMLGPVGEHNVVVSCPENRTGISNVVKEVAIHMISNFPSIKFVLGVGIGGGVPEAVRLGDIVVSAPTDELGAVVQWCDGPAEGSFIYKRGLSCPPTEILTALEILKKEYSLNGSKIRRSPLREQSLLISYHLKVEHLRDNLFQADCQHIDNPITGDAKAEGTREADHCSHCDRTKIIQRKPRGMCVHYGLIASSTQVIKHAPTRDKINTRLGGKVLCFETEAAGLVDDFPCLVIRGISDYADAHGSKAWQRHAAFAAAMFAKELLSYIPAQEVEQMPTIQGKAQPTGESNAAKGFGSHQQNQEYQTGEFFIQLFPLTQSPQPGKARVLRPLQVRTRKRPPFILVDGYLQEHIDLKAMKAQEKDGNFISLHNIYGQIMHRIEKQIQEHRDLAIQVLSLISSANKSLTPTGVLRAINSDTNVSGIGKNKVADIGLILSVCCELVTVDEKSNTIDLVHSSAREYFMQNWERWSSSSDTEMLVANFVGSEIYAEDPLGLALKSEGRQWPFGGFLVSQEACEKLAEALCKDPDLRTLYLEALTLLGEERFSKIHDGMLKRFLTLLGSQFGDRLDLHIVRLLGYASSRGRITEWILRLCVSSPDPEALPRQKFYDQKESRKTTLSRFLQDQAFHWRDISDSEDDDDDEASDGDAEDGNGPMRIRTKQLQKMISFLTRGSSYEDLKFSLYLLVHPSTSIPEAIQLGGVSGLRKLLGNLFDEIAIGEYVWINELREAGYSCQEIADLLYQDETDAPWIYFELELESFSPRFSPRFSPLFSPLERYPKDGVHVKKCVHCCFDNATTSDELQTQSFCVEEPTGSEQIQKLCGLAGVIPVSRDPSKLNGAVTFKDENSVAVISYAKFNENDELDTGKVLDRIITVLDRACFAAGRMQASDLCCDSFTVIVHRIYGPELDEGLTPVSMCRINFHSILQMLYELKGVSSCDNITQSKFTNVLRLQHEILYPIFRDFQGVFQSNDLDESLHSLSLMAQFISLGILSFNQGHAGPIQPFFLDTPQHKILLAGSKLCEHRPYGIIAELTNLSCIGDMVGGPVLSFKIAQLSMDGPYLQDETKFDLMANPEDLLDTWGPGSFIVHRDTASSCAIKICDGIIYAPRESTLKYHWSPTSRYEHLYPAYINPRIEICIGSLVSFNSYCNINEQECWERSSCAFENLDVYDDFWTHDESQAGFQAGNYVLLQANITKHRISGKTLKKAIIGWETEMLIPALNCLWGLQVSFCTGVTKRVPLRELIADVLPTFAKTFIRERAKWVELEEQHLILNAFRKDDFQERLAKLPPKLYSYLIRVIRRIIRALQSTGIDPEGKYLSVAWPYDSPPFRCFRISCHDRESSWTRVLADSEDCATFAYISTNCLVTNKVQCQGPSPLWRSTAPLLETAIIRHNGNYPGSLDCRRTYFFKKPDSLLKVVVEQQEDSGAMTLLVAPSTVPARVQQRLYRLDMMRNQWTQLRERQRLSEYAEHVAVLTKQ